MRVLHKMSRLLCLHGLFTVILLLLFCKFTIAAQVTSLNVHSGIGPATADYLVRGITNSQNSDLILIQIDTPGGLDKSMRQIVQSILISDVPVVVYVAPAGARAASAGTFLIYASTIAAMAPGTHLGAASPVDMMGGMGEQGDKGEDDKAKTQKTTMDKKTTNDAVAYIRTLAQLRSRNIDFAEKAVLDAATLTASEARKAGVINFIAQDQSDLLEQINGVTVTQHGQQMTLDTTNPIVKKIEPDWRMRFLLVITDPTIAYLLLLLGIYGIFFEMLNPGIFVPGVIGAVAILIALYALQLLPINYAGLGLILLGVAFIVAEALTPSFGVLGLGGTVAFIVGSILLIDTQHHSYQIAWSVIGMMAAVNVTVFLMILTMVIKARKRPIQHGSNVLIGSKGRALGRINLKGQAVINGEIWSVYAKEPISQGSPIKVVDAKGLILEVEAIQGELE